MFCFCFNFGDFIGAIGTNTLITSKELAFGDCRGNIEQIDSRGTFGRDDGVQFNDRLFARLTGKSSPHHRNRFT